LLWDGSNCPNCIADDASNVNWGNADGTVLTVQKVGGVVATLATGQESIDAIQVDDANLYWISTGATMKLSPK
jgi:hypothetical protein